MLEKQKVLYNKCYKPKFLLAWAKFLTYDELTKADQLDAYDADLLKHLINSPSDWNKNVIEYNEDNIKKALCIAIFQAYNDLYFNNGIMSDIYCDDIKTWLYILDNKHIKFKNNIKDFYDKVSTFYQFCIPEK